MQACVTKMKHLLMIWLMKYEIIGSQHKIIFLKVVFYVYMGGRGMELLY